MACEVGMACGRVCMGAIDAQMCMRMCSLCNSGVGKMANGDVHAVDEGWTVMYLRSHALVTVGWVMVGEVARRAILLNTGLDLR